MTAVRAALHALHTTDLRAHLHAPDLRRTFRSLRTHNFRLYAAGQALSLIGTWMQRLGQEWLVLELTGSGSWLGVVAALQFLPLLLIGPWGGLVADRVDKRRLLLITQSAAGVLAALLGIVTLTGVVELWMVVVLALALGVVTALDNPTRQAFVVEMVGADDVTNAVTLNSVMINAARAIGPALAGVLIATVGMAPTFLGNAASYAMVVLALLAMDPDRLESATRATRGPRQLREGFAYVARTPQLRTPLLLMVVAGMLAYEFTVTLPLLARYAFDGDARTLGILNSALGIGAVVGGLVTAGRERPTDRSVLAAALAFGTLLLVTSAAPTLWMAAVALLLTGAVSITFLASANSLLQLRSPDAYRGRIMSLWSIALLGTTPLGAPLVGWIGQVSGARASLAVGGVGTLLAAAAVAIAGRRRGRSRPGEDPAPAPPSASTTTRRPAPPAGLRKHPRIDAGRRNVNAREPVGRDMRHFSITWDYRCPFARNANEHVLAGMAAGADWEVSFIPFALGQVHVKEGEPPLWERPDDDSGMYALQVGTAVRDLDPARFPAVHRALFALRHDHGGHLRDRAAVRAVLEDHGIDTPAVLAHVEDGHALATVREDHQTAAADHNVWGVPTFVSGGRAVFIRLMDRPDGDGARATRTIERVLDLLDGFADLNEFKHTTVPR